MKSFYDKLNILKNGFVFFIFLLGCTEVAFAAGQEMSMRGGGLNGMSIIYGILAGISLMLLVGYSALVKKKEIWLLFLFVSIFLVNAGYFSLSLSKTGIAFSFLYCATPAAISILFLKSAVSSLSILSISVRSSFISIN